MAHRHVCCPAGMSATGRVSTARRSGGGTKRPTPPTFCRQASCVHAGGICILLAACSLKSSRSSLSRCESRAHDFVLGTVLHPPRFPFGALLPASILFAARPPRHPARLRAAECAGPGCAAEFACGCLCSGAARRDNCVVQLETPGARPCHCLASPNARRRVWCGAHGCAPPHGAQVRGEDRVEEPAAAAGGCGGLAAGGAGGAELI